MTSAYNKLTAQIDNVNKDLKLEQYAPIVSAEETTSESAASQSCALGGGEVSTGVELIIGVDPFEEAETGSDEA